MPYTPTTWVEGVTTLGPTNMNHLETGVGAAVPKDTVTTAGDLIVATGNAAVTRLAAGTAGQVLGGTGPSYAFPPGYEFAYNEFTSSVNVTTTSEATAVTVVTASAVTFDGSTVARIEFHTPRIDATASGRQVSLVLYQDGSSIGLLHSVWPGSAVQLLSGAMVARRMTPASGARTYSVRAFSDSAATTAVIAGAAGGSGSFMPGYIRITKV